MSGYNWQGGKGLHRYIYNKQNQMSETAAQLLAVEEVLDGYNRLLIKTQTCRIELDCPEGQELFRNYAKSMTKLMEVVEITPSDRSHRSQYTSAYRMLYDEGCLGYIPEIYDSAQEGFPFIFVNGERFDFSAEVLILGEKLVQAHFRLVHELRIVGLKKSDWAEGVATSLEEWDASWIEYEQKYITELIKIENHSKEVIKGFIKVEEDLTHFEIEEKQKGRIFLHGDDYDDLRRKLCSIISRLNSVANIQGKGRDDLGLQVLLAAEQVLTRVTENQALSVRLLAQKIRNSWEAVREVLKFFGESFEMVDPQLRNNAELVAALRQYESSWEKGKRYFLEQKKQSQIVACSTIVDAAKEKYPRFNELLEESDPSIFWVIPSLIVLRSLEGEDEGLAEGLLVSEKGSSQRQDYDSLKIEYSKMRGDGFELYNRLEQLLIADEQPCQEMLPLRNSIRQMGVSLERVSPTDWNDMLGVLLLEQE